MLKNLFEKYPIRFSIIFAIIYIIIDVADARWFIPKMRDKCRGELTEQQKKICFHYVLPNHKEKNE